MGGPWPLEAAAFLEVSISSVLEKERRSEKKRRCNNSGLTNLSPHQHFEVTFESSKGNQMPEDNEVYIQEA